jgi:RNA polymerase sigma-70 factor, ECF subfamily
VPEQPRAWRTRTAQNKTIDRIRRRANFRVKQEQLRDLVPTHGAPLSAEALMAQRIPDDRLRLVFTCCHPALKMEARVALILGAQQKITKAGIPDRVPPADQLPERVAGGCAVVYSVFSEGYAATGGEHFVRVELCAQAIQLGRVLAQLKTEGPRVLGLPALMLLHDSQRSARLDADGDIFLLEDQQRSTRDRERIDDGLPLTEHSLRLGTTAPGGQDAISAVPARSDSYVDASREQIPGLYGVLLQLQPSPVVALNHAVAVAMATEPSQGPVLLEGLAATGLLASHHLLPEAKGDLLRRLDRWREAAAAFQAALALVRTGPERRFLQRRLIEASERAGGTERTPHG